MIPMSIIGAVDSVGEEGFHWEEEKDERRCSAARAIMTIRSSKSAGLGFLSALTVASKNRTRGFVSRFSEGSEGGGWLEARAVLTRLTWAFEGGLKLESRT